MATLDDVLRENQAATDALREIERLLNGLLPGRGGPGGGASTGVGGAGGFASALGEIAGAATAVAGALSGAAYAALQFVRALNPGLAAQFGQEVKNLVATIGHSLTPIIQTAIPIVRQLSAIFLDLSQELRPIVADIADAIGAEFIAVVRAASVWLKVILTLLEPLAALIGTQMNYVAQLVELWSALVKTVVELIGQFIRSTGITGMASDAFKELIHWINRTAGVMANLAARVLIFFGLTSAVAVFRKNLLDAIRAKTDPKGGLLAAPEGARTTGIEEVAKRFAEKAFVASSAMGGAKKTDVEFLEEIAAGLKDALKGEREWKEVIAEALGEYFPKLGAAPNVARGLAEIRDRSATAGGEVVDALGLDELIPGVFGPGGLLGVGKARRR